MSIVNFETQYIYTQEKNDIRGKLWTKYVLKWLFNNPSNNNDDIRDLDKERNILVAELFTLKRTFKEYEVNPVFINFMRGLAYYHAILNVGNLQNNKYSLNLYNFLHKNINNFDTLTQKMYNTFFRLYKKNPTGIFVKCNFSDIINPSDYDITIIRLSSKATERIGHFIPNFAFVKPVKNLVKDYKSMFNTYYNYAINLLRSDITNIDTLYNILKIDFANNEYAYKWTLHRIPENDKLLINNCFGLGLDERICPEFLQIVLRNLDKDNFLKFLEEYLDKKYNWSVNIKNVDRLLIYKIFRALNIKLVKKADFYTLPSSEPGYNYKNWINYDINKLKNKKIIELIKNNTSFLNFVKKLIDYANETAIIHDIFAENELFEELKTEQLNKIKNNNNYKSWLEKNSNKDFLNNYYNHYYGHNDYNHYDDYNDHNNYDNIIGNDETKLYRLLYALFVKSENKTRYEPL
ncbi:hypothetical protein Hokovirus_2_202 [Hokovirus HKV1]|uniref:Uncharacterized protein n=1 Tax=Hokovirus HKV1 TaxID=1977638 RepID=A0A1V0SG30_9VIRU|nr:hypothetical protein Hokovirus_2_202 [Hokovirus HKV1]